MTRRVAIVGAGVAGLAAARRLTERGAEVTLFDKGRSVGGRVATRRREREALPPLQFDHGAQFFTVRDARFAAALAPLRDAGHIALWPGPFRTLAQGSFGPDPRPGAERFVGTPGMSALARGLAAQLPVTQNQRIAALRRRADAWELWSDHAVPVVHGPFDAVVLALPPAQASALLGADHQSPVARAARELSAALQPCLAAMVEFTEPLPLAGGGMFVTDPVLAFAAHDGGKPARSGGATYVLHGSAAWSAAQIETDPQASAHELVAALARALAQRLPPLRHLEGHRWRYALAQERQGDACVLDRSCGLALAGDAVAGGRVEGAWCSGLAAGDAV